MLIKIREDIAGLDRARAGLRDAKKSAGELGTLLKQGLGIGSGMQIASGAITLLTRSLSASVGEAFRLAQQIDTQSKALGISAEAYQVFRRELTKNGLESTRFEQAISAQNNSLIAARAGAGGAAEAYKALGLAAQQLEGLRPDERVLAVARAVEQSTDRTKAFQAAGAILGQDKVPLLIGSLRDLATKGYDKVALAAKSAGQVMEEETIDRLARAKTALDEFRTNTLPVAAGTAINWVQGIMDTVGATIGNFTNFLAGRGNGDLDLSRPKPQAPPPSAPGPARADLVLDAQLANAEAKASAFQNASLFTETERRRALLPVLREQEQLLQNLIAVKFGDTAKTLPKDGQVTEAELAAYKERNDLEWQLTSIRQQRMAAVDTPLAALWRQMSDTTNLVQNTLVQGIQGGLSQLSADIWASMKGVQSWGEAWRNLGDMTGRILTELILRLTIVRALSSLFGAFAGAGPTGTVSAGAATVVDTSAVATNFADLSTTMTPVGAFAGGGDFLTRGPTSIIVGDNPGGIERVKVTPISGIGRSYYDSSRIRLAGGGNVTALGSRTVGEGAPVTVQFNFSTGVAATVRAEIQAMSPQLRQLAVNAVAEANRRNEVNLR